MRILVTGAAGFIGSRLAGRLLAAGHRVWGLDCFSDYYPRELKERNLQPLRDWEAFTFQEADLTTCHLPPLLEQVEAVAHLAAQAGVRRSWGQNFQIYLQNNVAGTQRLLEAARERGLKRLVYASSSSVYGDTPDLPMREEGLCRPVSPYGVSKLAGEHLCWLYHQNFGLDTVSLRYFTVYGPGQRPDMAFHRFIRALITGSEITLYGDGEQSRDFTYIDDVVQGTVAALGEPSAGGGTFNLGGGSRVTINQMIAALEGITGRSAQVRRLPAAKGDVHDTEADCSRAQRVLGFAPKVSLHQGLAAQVDWLKNLLGG